MQRILRIVLICLLWAVVAAYLFYAASTSRSAHQSRRVREVRIGVLDSTDQGSLIGERQCYLFPVFLPPHSTTEHVSLKKCPPPPHCVREEIRH